MFSPFHASEASFVSPRISPGGVQKEMEGCFGPACLRSEGHSTQCVNENSLVWVGELLILDVGECMLGRASATETDETDEREERGRQKLTGREKRSRGEATETEHVSHSRFLSVLHGRLREEWGAGGVGRHVAPPSPSIKTSSFIDR